MKTIGIFGLGAFGQLMARTLVPYFRVLAHDPSPAARRFAARHNVELVSMATCAAMPIVVLAVPVDQLAPLIDQVADQLQPGSTILDVASVKALPARLLAARIPDGIDIIGTHPLFGPQSARAGVAGHKLVLCPIRTRRIERFRRFLSAALRLEVAITTPEDHDRELASVQGLTHLIARVLMEMEPLPRTHTTRSFELLLEAIGYVSGDSEALFLAIERDNPFSEAVRHRFFAIADQLRARLDGH